MTQRLAPLVIGEHNGPRGRRLAVAKRAAKPRRIVVLWAAAAALGLALLIGAGWWALRSPVFAVARVETGPYRFSERQEVEAALRACLGQNLWRLRGGHVAAALADLPWVEAVRVSRRVPDTVLVALQEWRPLLVVGTAGAAEGHELLLVGDGSVRQLAVQPDSPVLPVLVDCGVAQVAPGRWRLEGCAGPALVELVEAMAATGLEQAAPVDFVRATAEGFVLVLRGRTGSLLVGEEGFADRLTRYLLARARIPAGALVDLRFADRITFVPPDPART